MSGFAGRGVLAAPHALAGVGLDEGGHPARIAFGLHTGQSRVACTKSATTRPGWQLRSPAYWSR